MFCNAQGPDKCPVMLQGPGKYPVVLTVSKCPVTLIFLVNACNYCVSIFFKCFLLHFVSFFPREKKLGKLFPKTSHGYFACASLVF